MKVGAIAAVLLASIVVASPSFGQGQSLPQAWKDDPRKLGRMPTLEEIPNPRMSSAQVTEECARYFDNKRYSGGLAAASVREPNQAMVSQFSALFETDRTVTTIQGGQRTVCLVTYSYRMGYGSGTRIRLNFDGKTAFRHDSAQSTDTGILMVAENGTLNYVSYYRNKGMTPLLLGYGRYVPD